ncbi:MAG: hypothetical protein Q8O74_05365, partial [bacterium]|nr:hypothetical protein [bacterium]
MGPKSHKKKPPQNQELTSGAALAQIPTGTEVVTVVVDAMGGDHGPAPIIEGAIQAAKLSKGRYKVILVGDEVAIKTELAQGVGEDEFEEDDLKKYGVDVVHASQTVEMHESPTDVLRRKRDSSILVGLRLQKEKKAQAFISTGNTGAVMAAALFELGRLKGVARPAIASFMPTEHGGCIMIDVGANMDCKPHH